MAYTARHYPVTGNRGGDEVGGQREGLIFSIL